jgi:adenine/guanine phosphoribosyltransferase-like PRPP-binding protein
VPSATPIPRTLYVHDDLSDDLRALGEASQAWRLGQALFALLRRDAGRVVVLTLDEQIDGLVARGDHAPFATAVGIGRAGVRVAEAVHARTSWFPSIHRVDLWREEDDDGGYTLSGPSPLASQVSPLPHGDSVAVVDDTIFSGLTMRAVLAALPRTAAQRLHAFCLRAVAESLPDIAELAPVTAGFAARGRMLDDVSFINASGLVKPGAIRRAGRPALAFYERSEWMEAWFPADHAEIIAVCHELATELAIDAVRAPASPAQSDLGGGSEERASGE